MNVLMKYRLFLFFFAFCIVLVSVHNGICQDEKSKLDNRAAQYYLGSEDELLIKVNVWGFVARPGQYLVPSDTDLISLLSFVGGPLANANLKKIKLVRSGTEKGQVIKVNINHYLTTGSQKVVPDLLPGDTILVPASKMYYVNKFFEYASRIAIVVQAMWYIELMIEK